MCRSLFILQLCRQRRFMVEKVGGARKNSSWTITTEQLRGKNSEETDYFKMGKLADYSVPDKVIAVATDQNPPAKFLDRIRYSDHFKTFFLSAYKNEFVDIFSSRWCEDNTLTRLGKNTYVEAFRTMIYFEEFAEQQQVEQFNLKGIKFHHVERNEFLFFVQVWKFTIPYTYEKWILSTFYGFIVLAWNGRALHLS